MNQTMRFAASGLMRRHAAISLLGLLAAGCSTMSRTGPSISQIRSEYDSDPHPFELVKVTTSTLEVLKHRPAPSFQSLFGDDPAPVETRIGSGDGVTVTIWEVGTDTLFAPPPVATQSLTAPSSSRGSLIPEQIVGSDGSISIPFAGRVLVAGLTTLEAQQAVEHALAGKAQKPQVLVNITRNANNAVTINGEGAGGTRVALSTYGERLLDVLAMAGGAKAPTYATRVQLTRGGVSLSVPMLDVLHDPKQNIRLHPGDNLVVTAQPESFTAFGALLHSAQLNFDAEQISLNEAMGKANGMDDTRADPRGVFLMRFEPRSIAEQVGTAPTGGDIVPVVYWINLEKAGSFFLAQDFQLRDHDVLYVANADTTQLQKFLNLLSLISQPVTSGAVLDSSVK
jgi:polysaccharide biosynthesis/export protein